MTKRELNTILRQYKLGVSKDVCRTAILQLCCPSVPRKELNAAADALDYFESEAFAIDILAGDYTVTLSDIKPDIRIACDCCNGTGICTDIKGNEGACMTCNGRGY